MPTPDQITLAVAAGVSPPVDEERWERRMKALTLRNAGGTFSQIAAQLGISATVVRADVRIALREVLAETIEDGVARQVSVLRDMQRGAYPGAMSGDKDSIMAIVRCLEQEAKLKGFYAPARMAVGISDVDFAEQAAELITKLGLEPPRELMIHGRQDNAADVAGRAAGAAVAGLGSAGDQQPVEVGEVIDGVIERFGPAPGAAHQRESDVVGFDIPAYGLPIYPGEQPLGADISDAAIGDAAAAAIDPEAFGERSVSGADTSDNAGNQGDGNGWSNL